MTEASRQLGRMCNLKQGPGVVIQHESKLFDRWSDAVGLQSASTRSEASAKVLTDFMLKVTFPMAKG